MRYLFLLFLSISVFTAFAQIPKPQKNTYVNDFAHVLTKAQVRQLNVQIHKIERTSSVQIAVVLINKLPKYYEIEDYALLIGRKWHVGTNQNGLVYVAAIQQHKQRLEVARKLENIVTDSIAGEVLAGIKPFFREQDYAGGLQFLVGSLDSLVHPAIQPSQAAQGQQALADTSAKVKAKATIADKPMGFWDFVSGWLGIIGIGYLIIKLFRIWINRPSRTGGGYNSGSYGGISNTNVYNNYPSGRRSFWGGLFGGMAAGYTARRVEEHWWNTSSSSNNSDSQSTTTSNNDSDSSNWGNWNSGSSSDSSSSDSSDDGYSGSGASSDW